MTTERPREHPTEVRQRSITARSATDVVHAEERIVARQRAMVAASTRVEVAS